MEILFDILQGLGIILAWLGACLVVAGSILAAIKFM